MAIGGVISEQLLLFDHVVIRPDDGRLDPRPMSGIDERLAGP